MSFRDITWFWQLDSKYLCSTNPVHLQPEAINDAFDSEYMYWTKRLPPATLQQLLTNSLCIGLYDTSDSLNWSQIGFRRLITDTLTFAYITDFYVLPSYRGRGLGKFLQRCTKDLLDMIERSMDRNLRGFRVVTLTREENVGWWEKELGVRRVDQGKGGGVYVERSGVRGADAIEKEDG